MMKKVISYQLSAISFVLIFSAACYAAPVSSADLINNAKEYDGKTVTYEGEVIGDIMARGEYAWVNVNDSVNALGIWAPKAMIRDIIHKGAYNTKGDMVEITGVFHRSCVEHGGDLDIHAESLIKLEDGYQISDPPDAAKKRYAFILGIILVFVSAWRVYRKVARKSRKSHLV